jgi:hypothetical protein
MGMIKLTIGVSGQITNIPEDYLLYVNGERVEPPAEVQAGDWIMLAPKMLPTITIELNNQSLIGRTRGHE